MLTDSGALIATCAGFKGLLEPDDLSEEEEEEVCVVMVIGIVTLVDGEVIQLELLEGLRLARMPIFGVAIPVVGMTLMFVPPVERRVLARDDWRWRCLFLVRDLRFWNQ
jgi:hypothetical protein